MNKKAVKTKLAPSADTLLSQAIVAGDFVFVSGQIHNTTSGELVNGDVKTKLDQIFKNISEILEIEGLSLSNIIKVTIYVTSMDLMKDINKLYASYLGSVLPAREAICVKELPLGASIEISVVAYHES